MACSRIALLALSGLLLACTGAEPKVTVTKSGATVTVAVERAGAATPCVKSLTVTLDGADIAQTQPVWEVSTAQPNRCAASFVLGQAPAGYAQARAAPELANGTKYLVEVSGPGLLGGATFTMREADGALTDRPAG